MAFDYWVEINMFCYCIFKEEGREDLERERTLRRLFGEGKKRYHIYRALTLPGILSMKKTLTIPT